VIISNKEPGITTRHEIITLVHFEKRVDVTVYPSNVKLTLKLKLKLTIMTYWFSINREKLNFVLFTITEKCSII